MHLFGNFHSTDRPQHLLNITIDGELEGSEGANHEETGTETGERALDAELLADLDQAGSGALTRETRGLVDLREHGVGGLGDDGSSETGNETGAKVDGGLQAVGHILLGPDAVDSLGNLLVHDELGHGVGDLLEEDGAETSVEGANTLVLQDLAEAAEQAAGESRLRDETDTGSLKRAEGNIGEELGGSRRGEVDAGAVIGGGLVAEEVNVLLLEELVAAKLEGTLEEVADEGRANTGQKGTSTLVLNDLLEAAEHAIVVGLGVELDTSLDDINGSQSTVGDGAADGAGEGEAGVELNAAELLLLLGGHFGN